MAPEASRSRSPHDLGELSAARRHFGDSSCLCTAIRSQRDRQQRASVTDPERNVVPQIIAGTTGLGPWATGPRPSALAGQHLLRPSDQPCALCLRVEYWTNLSRWDHIFWGSVASAVPYSHAVEPSAVRLGYLDFNTGLTSRHDWSLQSLVVLQSKRRCTISHDDRRGALEARRRPTRRVVSSSRANDSRTGTRLNYYPPTCRAC